MVNYVFRFEIAASFIVAAVIITYFKMNRIKTRVSSAFTALTWQCLTASILEILSIYLLKYVTKENLWINLIVNIMY